MQHTLTRYEDGVIARALSQNADDLLASWRLVYYPPFTRLDFHDHDVAHFSALLCGEAREATGKEEIALRPMLMEFKPAGFRHANAFGPDGALMLSINVSQNNPQFTEMFSIQDWMFGDGLGAHAKWSRLARHVLSGGTDADEMETITFDLLSMMQGRDAAYTPAPAPAWLRRAHEALIETDLSVAEIAADAGVHRAHLSRAFRRHFGCTISDRRHQMRLARAVRYMTCAGASAVDASYAAGFSDQSHLTRIMRRNVGVTPGALRTGLAGL